MVTPMQTDNPNFRRLAAAVIAQAVRDAKQRHDRVKQLDAVIWLTGPDAPLFLDGLGVGELDPLELVTSGKLRRIKEKVIRNA